MLETIAIILIILWLLGMVSGYTLGTDCYVNSPNNISVSGGALSLTVRKEAAPFNCLKPGGSGFTTDVTCAPWSAIGGSKVVASVNLPRGASL